MSEKRLKALGEVPRDMRTALAIGVITAKQGFYEVLDSLFPLKDEVQPPTPLPVRAAEAEDPQLPAAA